MAKVLFALGLVLGGAFLVTRRPPAES